MSATGTQLGPYILGESIGAGGMGEVFRARDARLGRDVAVKILPPQFAADKERLHRFEQEARSTAALQHPNILAVYDVGTHDGCPYIVSELLHGDTLRERLADGSLPTRKVIDWSLQICRGLAAAHERGIVHRDLKPDNIFVTNDGQVKILDFGLAKLTRTDAGVSDQTISSSSAPGTVVGTLGYMSPEQVRGKEADSRSDLFSFGAVLYEMISGKRAFKGESPADTVSAILREEPPDLSDFTHNVSPALERVVRHCLEKNPHERFQSARDLAFQLEALSGGSSKLASDIQLPKTSRRRWLPLVLAVAAAIALTAAFFIGRFTHPVTNPQFRQMTFRGGTLYGARFAHDGNTILYSAAWEGKPVALFTSHSGTVESRSLAPETLVAAISSKDQMAVLLDFSFVGAGSVTLATGTLALLPIEGGTPRPILRNVNYADWTPDGAELAVIRVPQEPHPLASNVLQFPVDKTIYAPQRGWLSHVRFSPSGRYLAFEEHVRGGDNGTVIVIDRTGKKIAESALYASINGLAWRSDQEVWYTASRGEESRAVFAMDLKGRSREVYSAPDDLTLHDITPDGQVLLTADRSRLLLLGGNGNGPDKDLSWLGWSLSSDISRDGSTAVFSESGPAVAGTTTTVLRKLDGSPAVSLGEGLPVAISPDGNWVAALDEHVPANVILLPTGVGKPKQLTSNGWDYDRGMYWMPDGKGLVVGAVEPGHQPRRFLLDITSGAMRPVLPENVRVGAPSPDGKFLLGVVSESDGFVPKIYTLAGTEIRSLPKLADKEVIDQWSADGKSILIWNYTGIPRLDRMDVVTGKRTPVGSVSPPDRTGLVSFNLCRATPDGRTHIYSAYRLLTDLFVVNGLR